MKRVKGTERNILGGIIFLIVIMSLASSCTKTMNSTYGTGGTGGTGSKGGPGTNEVWIQGMAFNPSTITVTAGTTITWTNKDPMAHTVTSTNGAFTGSGPLGTNEVLKVTFAMTGSYPYKCSIHPYMTGTVVVN